MMLVFEMGGTIDHVRKVWSNYRKENYLPINVPASNFEPQKPVTRLDLAIHMAMWMDGRPTLLTLEAAKQKLWKRAEEQEITGYGEPLSGPRVR